MLEWEKIKDIYLRMLIDTEQSNITKIYKGVYLIKRKGTSLRLADDCSTNEPSLNTTILTFHFRTSNCPLDKRVTRVDDLW